MSSSDSYKRNSSDPDPGVWLPLLKGFFQRYSTISAGSVPDTGEGSNSNLDYPRPIDRKELSLKALSVFRAERIISSWLISILQKKRLGDIKFTNVKQHTHFLLRALTSSSLAIRRLAVTFILDATDPMELVKAHINHPQRLPGLVDPAGRVLLRDMFWTFAIKDIEDMVTCVTPSLNNSNLYVPSHDGIIQIYGVLSHLIFDDDGAWYAQSYYCNRDDDIQIDPCCAIEIFLASGGLRWIAASLVRLISALLREENFDVSHLFSLPDQSYAEAVQLRIILLVDLCNRLFMHIDLNPIRFPDGYWQSVLPENLDSNFDVEKNKMITRIEKKRKDCRVRTLYSAFHLLWSSQIPAITMDSLPNNRGTTLSSLACLIACHAVLRREDDLNAMSNLVTSTALSERHTSVNHDAHRSGFKNFFELPFLPQRLEGIDQALDTLQKIIDPMGNLFFTGATYVHTPKMDPSSKGQSDSNKVASTNLNSNASLDNQNNRKRSRSVSSSSDIPSKKKANVEVNDETGNCFRESDQADMSMLVGERKSHSNSDPTTQSKNDFVMESSGNGDEEDDDEEVPEDEYGNDDGMIDVDDEVDDEDSENDECSDYDPSELANCTVFEAETDLNGNQQKAERLLLSDASMSIIPKIEREKSLIRASMEVLHANYVSQLDCKLTCNDKESDELYQDHLVQSCEGALGSKFHRSSWGKMNIVPLLTVTAEQFLLESICNIVKPTPKPFKMKIVMKRAPTQEEFFRGSLSRNPINLESIKVSALNSPTISAGGNDEPRVRDLRQHIARDLKMEDSAELLELLVGNKILGLSLKLRVVCQVIWKKHIMEKATSNVGASSSLLHSSLLSRRADSVSGFSLSFNPANYVDSQKSGENSNLPPMVVTYRLIGVDGEATEERVEDGSLIDPEAPCETQASNEENEKLLEEEYGLTYIVTDQRGVQVLLRSLESYLRSCIQSIRRDDVTKKYQPDTRNTARALFLKSKICPSLLLLRHCARLKENRAKMVKDRAPTKLLRILLDILSCLEESRSPLEIVNPEPPNPTATGLQELIETLSSAISEDIVLFNGESKNNVSEEEDDGSLRLLLNSLRTTFLSAPLRAVISKLLPYLTYGQPQLSRDLATDFVQHVSLEKLGSTDLAGDDNAIILMDTLVDCAIHLPPRPLFNHLRIELLRQNFVSRLVGFVEQMFPDVPPHWCPALFENIIKMEAEEKKQNENKWRIYFCRQGLISALRILVGLATNHPLTQNEICGFHESTVRCPSSFHDMDQKNSFIVACHWIESISDFNDISTCGLGIQAETLLDTLSENIQLSTIISTIRSKTRDNKKTIANERRKALMVMNSFPSAEGASLEPSPHATNSARKKSLHNHSTRDHIGKTSANKESKSTNQRYKPTQTKSQWLKEIESIEDESGLTCVVCQEGRKVQPRELLGLYAFAKKIALTSKSSVSSIDGTDLLISLPRSIPPVLSNTANFTTLFDSVMSAVDRMQAKKEPDTFYFDRVDRLSASSPSLFISSVSAGNAIHCTCHMKARVADKNNSKAPKNEWEVSMTLYKGTVVYP